MPPGGSPGRAEAERRLAAQVGVVLDGGASGLFIPGNHDWQAGGRDGWQTLLREERYLGEHAGGRIRVLPGGGCPGPAVLDVGPRLRLVVLDTQWWLQEGEKPREPYPACATASEAAVLAALSAALRDAGERHVVVLAHHPLASGGQHGGRFGVREHLFPLTDLDRRLWVPLPLVGSFYPLSRSAGWSSSQDLTSPPYRHMREALSRVLSSRPPLLFAAGHEHNMQVHSGTPPEGFRTLVVSGSGIHGRKSPVRNLRSTLFSSEEAGFFALRVAPDGTATLAALVVSRDGRAVGRFAMSLP